MLDKWTRSWRDQQKETRTLAHVSDDLEEVFLVFDCIRTSRMRSHRFFARSLANRPAWSNMLGWANSDHCVCIHSTEVL